MKISLNTAERNNMVEVMYTKEMPVDEYGRPGGLLSLSDLPIYAFKTLTRKGTIDNYDSDLKSFRVKDNETGISMEIPVGDIQLIKSQENEDV